MARMLNWWGDVVVIGGMFPLIVADIVGHLRPVDQVYFRRTREARFGKPLEQVVANRDSNVESFRKGLDPLRLTLKTQPFLGGAAPNYADYIVFGGFQWARAVSAFPLLKPDDPVYAWRETLLDAFDGMARKSSGLCGVARSAALVRRLELPLNPTPSRTPRSCPPSLSHGSQS